MPQSRSSSIPEKMTTLMAALLVVATLYLAQTVLIPVALAILLSFLLAPLVHWLERWRIGRVPAVLGVVVLTFVLMGGIGWLVVSQAQQLGQNIEQYQDEIQHKFRSVQSWLGGTLGKANELAQKISKDIASTTQPAETSPNAPLKVQIVQPPPSPVEMIVSVVERTIGPLLQPLATAGIVIVLVIFMLMGHENLRDRFISLVGQSQLTTTTQALDEAAYRVSRYLIMQSVINGTYALALCIGLWIIGIPVPFLWGLLAGMLRFIPYVGPWLGASMPILLSLALPSPWTPLYTGGLFIVLELLSNTLMEPLLYGASTGVSPIAILVAAIFWAWLWGPVGLILATPLTVCLVVMGKYVPQLSFLDTLLGDEPVLRPYVHYYQRLLAEDSVEAAALLKEHLDNGPAIEVYDQIVIPALVMAQRDFHRGYLDSDRRETIHEIVRGHILHAAAWVESKSTAQKDAPVDCLCLSAHDSGDELVCLMLEQIIQSAHFTARIVPASTLVSSMVQAAERERPKLVCVSALPPSAVAHCRYLCKRLHRVMPEMPMIIGLWRSRTNPQHTRERIGCGKQVRVVTTLNDTMTQIRQFIPQAGTPTAEQAVEP